jgi:UPF0148 protein
MSGKEMIDDKNQKIQKITTLLERGGTMLANHHECGAPMFRYQGKTVCPVCDFQERPEIKELKIEEYKKEPEIKKEIKTQKPRIYDTQMISRIITGKILDIAAGLEAETDLQRVKDKLECIEQGIKILKLLQD